MNKGEVLHVSRTESVENSHVQKKIVIKTCCDFGRQWAQGKVGVVGGSGEKIYGEA